MRSNTRPRYCKNCGAKFYSSTGKCSYCGAEQVEEKTFACSPQTEAAKSNTEDFGFVFAMRKRNKRVALLLCVFLGIFGAHRFYNRDKKMGFLYLFTLGLVGVGWIIDLVSIMRKPNPYYIR